MNPKYSKLYLLEIVCVIIFTSTSASSNTILNLLSKYFVFVLINLNLKTLEFVSNLQPRINFVQIWPRIIKYIHEVLNFDQVQLLPIISISHG